MKSIWKWIASHFAIETKVFTIFIMFATVCIMLDNRYFGKGPMLDFYQFSKHDWWFWLLINILGVILNTGLLINTKCIKCRLLSDLMLQLSGFLILLMGWVFIVKYPPLNGFMITYPIWGILVIVVGRHMGKRSRELRKLLG